MFGNYRVDGQFLVVELPHGEGSDDPHWREYYIADLEERIESIRNLNSP